MSSQTIYTVGHSTRMLDEFIEMLRLHGVSALADVRQYPRSRRFPHFNEESLAAILPKSGMHYLPFKSLGGRRKAAADSVNTGWRNEGFRGFADYMQTAGFVGALDELIAHARSRPTAIMCAEAVPWRCHRRLIADALLARGWTVLDIIDRSKVMPHRLLSFARVEGWRVTYPAEDDERSLFSHQS